MKMELEWWLSNRVSAPIVVDPTGEGLRWVPETIRKKWPNIQRVPVVKRHGKIEDEALSIEQLTKGLQVSGVSELFRELAERRRLIRRITTVLVITSVLLVAAIVGVFVTIRLYKQISSTQASLAKATAVVSQLEQSAHTARGQLEKVKESNKRTTEQLDKAQASNSRLQGQIAFVEKTLNEIRRVNWTGERIHLAWSKNKLDVEEQQLSLETERRRFEHFGFVLVTVRDLHRNPSTPGAFESRVWNRAKDGTLSKNYLVNGMVQLPKTNGKIDSLGSMLIPVSPDAEWHVIWYAVNDENAGTLEQEAEMLARTTQAVYYPLPFIKNAE